MFIRRSRDFYVKFVYFTLLLNGLKMKDSTNNIDYMTDIDTLFIIVSTIVLLTK